MDRVKPRDSERAGPLARATLMAVSTGCALCALGFIGVFVWIATHRAAYPFDLEWMEGGMVDHVARLLAGKNLYAPPTVDFVSFIYNPLYYFLAAPFALVFGVGHLALRLVSIVATLAAIVLIFAIVWKETRQRLPALVAAGMFAGTYALSGGWFDLARVDSTCLAFCLGSWYLARFNTSRRGIIASAAMLGFAFLTKQAALALAPALVVATGLLHGFRRTPWLLPVAGFVLAAMAALEVSSGGWYSFYTFQVPSGFPSEPDMVIDFWKKEIFSEYPMALVLGLYFALSARDKMAWNAALKVDLPFIVSMVGMAYAVRMHSGSYYNDKMPAHASLAVAAGLGLALLSGGEPASRRTGMAIRGYSGGEPTSRRTRMAIYGYSIALAQLFFLVYPVEHWIPTRLDVAEGRAFVSTMRSYPGDVLVTHHGALNRLAGKPPCAQGMAVFDVVRTSHDRRGAQRILRESFQRAFSTHRFSAVFTDDGLVMNDLLEKYYQRGPSFVRDANAMVPKTGPTYRPRTLYTPKP